jgi:hypothetical protein
MVDKSAENTEQKDVMKSPVTCIVVNVTLAVGHAPPEPKAVLTELNALNKGVP